MTRDHDPLGPLWQRLAEEPHRTLALDYDGTLAPFQAERMAAVPLDGVVELLDAIVAAGSTSLWLVSGRPVAEVLELAGERQAHVIGSHGCELRRPDGTSERFEVDAGQRRTLDRAERAARSRAGDEAVERKLASVALHTRGSSSSRREELEGEIAELWSQQCDGTQPLELRRFDGGLELRVAGIDKGAALQRWLERPGERFEVYTGDDETDEDAMRVIAARGGVGIKVGPRMQPTVAQLRLPDCAAVRDELLRGWLREETRGR